MMCLTSYRKYLGNFITDCDRQWEAVHNCLTQEGSRDEEHGKPFAYIRAIVHWHNTIVGCEVDTDNDDKFN